MFKSHIFSDVCQVLRHFFFVLRDADCPLKQCLLLFFIVERVFSGLRNAVATGRQSLRPNGTGFSKFLRNCHPTVKQRRLPAPYKAEWS